MENKQSPSYAQMINRLIEFFDGELVLCAAQEYAKLIDAGLDSEHAFRLVTQK